MPTNHLFKYLFLYFGVRLCESIRPSVMKNENNRAEFGTGRGAAAAASSTGGGQPTECHIKGPLRHFQNHSKTCEHFRKHPNTSFRKTSEKVQTRPVQKTPVGDTPPHFGLAREEQLWGNLFSAGTLLLYSLSLFTRQRG